MINLKEGCLITGIYTNYKGVKNKRTILFKRLLYGKNYWHDKEQLLIEGICQDKKELRYFAIKDLEITEVTE